MSLPVSFVYQRCAYAKLRVRKNMPIHLLKIGTDRFLAYKKTEGNSGKLLRGGIPKKAGTPLNSEHYPACFKKPLMILASAPFPVRPRGISFMSCSPAILPMAASCTSGIRGTRNSGDTLLKEILGSAD